MPKRRRRRRRRRKTRRKYIRTRQKRGKTRRRRGGYCPECLTRLALHDIEIAKLRNQIGNIKREKEIAAILDKQKKGGGKQKKTRWHNHPERGQTKLKPVLFKSNRKNKKKTRWHNHPERGPKTHKEQVAQLDRQIERHQRRIAELEGNKR